MIKDYPWNTDSFIVRWLAKIRRKIIIGNQ